MGILRKEVNMKLLGRGWVACWIARDFLKKLKMDRALLGIVAEKLCMKGKIFDKLLSKDTALLLELLGEEQGGCRWGAATHGGDKGAQGEEIWQRRERVGEEGHRHSPMVASFKRVSSSSANALLQGQMAAPAQAKHWPSSQKTVRIT